MAAKALLTLVAVAATAALTGCGAVPSVISKAPIGTSAPNSLRGLHGKSFGGQQPLVGASIQIYQAGTTGYGAGATGLIAANGVTTDSGGNFSISGDYTCTPGSYVYMVSTGGNPGVANPNAGASLVAGLGLCDNLGPNTFIQINEATTVATVWALQAFLSTPASAAVLNETGPVDASGLNIGAPYANSPASGLAQAFADINTLVNIASGSSPGTYAAGVTVPAAKINTLADILAACINSVGWYSIACTNISSLVVASGSAQPYDTIGMAVAMARNPAPGSSNLGELVGTIVPAAPFQPALGSLNDLTLGVTYAGSGIDAPTAIAVDKGGNVWIANSGNNSVTELSHSGSVLSGAGGFTAGGISNPSSIALDNEGNVWVANRGSSTLTALDSTGTPLAGTPFAGGGLSSPVSLAIDASSNIWIANGSGTISEFGSTGGAVSSSSGFSLTGVSSPSAVAINPY